MIGIYKIENLINGKVYIGQSKEIEKRIRRHKKAVVNKNDKAYNYPLYKSIRKYGIENFSFKIIEECLVSELNEKERFWIKYYNSFFEGYNQTFGGDSSSTNQPKEKIIGIINDLENTNLFHHEISKKWDISTEMVQGINTGRYWRYDRNYPIQTIRQQKPKKHFFCEICGKEISKNANKCIKCNNKSRKKDVEKISRNQLKEKIRTISFLQIGKEFEVSDNAIRKWCDKYNLPRTKKEINSYTDEEWLNI